MKPPSWIYSAGKEIAELAQAHEAEWKIISAKEITEILARHACQPSSLPESLASNPAFVTTYGEWMTYLREKSRGKAITPTTIKKHLKELEDMGAIGAIASMEQSMHRNWQGLFPAQGDLKKVAPKSIPLRPIQKGQNSHGLFESQNVY